MQTRNGLWLLVLVTSVTCSLAQGEERLPEDVAERLGCDPSVADKFTVIWNRAAASEAKPPADAGRTPRRVSLANAGGNRFIWRVEFLAAYPEDSLLQIYLDADNSKDTGRQPNHGCEYMLRLMQGVPGVTAFTAEGQNRPAPPPRVAVTGDTAYLSYDVDLPQRDGASVFRLNILSETAPPVRGVYGSGYFDAQGPPLSERSKIVLDSDLTRSVGVEQTWGLDRIHALVEDPQNVGIWIRDCQLDGFRFDRSEYRADNALRSSASGTITARIPQGRTLPLQAAVTGRWADGSVKWLLVDFRHSEPAAAYTLEFGPDVDRREPELPTATLSDLGELVLADAAGREHSARVADLRAEEGAGLRAGWHGSGPIGSSNFSWETRVHVYPGLPWARVLLTFGHDVSPDEFTTVRSLAWRLPTLRGQPRFVRQHTDNQFESSSGSGKRFSGSLGPVRVRDFWQNYPKDLEIGNGGATLWLLPRLKPDEFDWAQGTFDEHRLFFWFDPRGTGGEAGGYRMRQGMTKTHEIWLGLDGRQPPYDRPLLAVAPPRWYADSGVFGELTVADAERPVVRDYDQKVTDTLHAYLQNRERNREYGLFNFGDWWGERVINWGNIEYDTQHAFFLQFVRSGDLRFFHAGEEAETHNRDVDTVHYHREADRIGGAYTHCIGHVGNYYDKSPLPGKNQGIAGGHFSVSHTWCEGHMDHFFLTGDRRSLETGLKIADRYNVYRFNNYDFTNCRDAGWRLILTLSVYRATGDPFYLNAARIIVQRVLERQTPDAKFNTAGGGWRRMMVPGHCLCEPAHYGNAGFMVGVLLTGLKWYHLETQDDRVAESLVQASHFLIDDMWSEDVGGFRYTSCPESSQGAWSNFLLFDGMAYAYRLTQQAGRPDEKLATHLRKGTEPAIQAMSGMGKSFSQFIRVTPHFMGILAELQEQDL